jgi:hypothetical protein
MLYPDPSPGAELPLVGRCLADNGRHPRNRKRLGRTRRSFCENLTSLVFQPSRCSVSPLGRRPQPSRICARTHSAGPDYSSWPIASADAIICINMIHISPWGATIGWMQGRPRYSLRIVALSLWPIQPRTVRNGPGASNLPRQVNAATQRRPAAPPLRALHDAWTISPRRGCTGQLTIYKHRTRCCRLPPGLLHSSGSPALRMPSSTRAVCA